MIVSAVLHVFMDFIVSDMLFNLIFVYILYSVTAVFSYLTHIPFFLAVFFDAVGELPSLGLRVRCVS